MRLYQGLKKSFAAKMNLSPRREQVDVAVLYILTAALMLVVSAGLLVYGAVKDYRAENRKTGEMVATEVLGVPSNRGQDIQQINLSPVPPSSVHQQEQSNVAGKGSKDQSINSSSAHRRGKISKPINGAITVGYGWREHPVFQDWRFHSGIDIEAPIGTEVKAALSGKVMLIKREHNNMIVKTTDESGTTIIYGNLQKCYIETGQIISQGEIIGVMGETSSLGENGLHFEVWQNNKSVDPQSLIDW